MRKRPAGLIVPFSYEGETKKELTHVLTITIREIAKGQATAARTRQAPFAAPGAFCEL